MRIVRQPDRLGRVIRRWRADRRRIAFVPTMGYLHLGHLTLIRRAALCAERVVVSSFVNPLQFGPGEDLEAYPRAARRDRRWVADAGADLLYAPPVTAMYPPGFRTRVEVEELSGRLCGKSRPVHFAGVVTVVLKLLHQVEPDVLLLGQKDAQQALIVRRMMVDLDLHRRVALEVVPTVREPDGLAMSSRNRYLKPAERRQAPVLYRALRAGVSLLARGERRTAVVRRRIRAILRTAPLLRPEYVRLVDTESLLEHDGISGEILIAVAAQLGSARLIDNVIVSFTGASAPPAGRAAGGRRRRRAR